jgi:hypothetical protein
VRVGKGGGAGEKARAASASYIIEGRAEIRAWRSWVGLGWAGPLDPCGDCPRGGGFSKTLTLRIGCGAACACCLR